MMSCRVLKLMVGGREDTIFSECVTFELVLE